MPPDDKDPALPGATGGAVIEADAVGKVAVEISVNNGISWKKAGLLAGTNVSLDFTDLVKGRNGYLLRLRLDRGIGLNRMRLRNVVTVCRAVYPKLKSPSTTITYLADGLDAFEATPDLASKSTATDPRTFVAVENLTWSGYATGRRVAWALSKGTGSCTYKVTAPAGRRLKSVSAGACVVWPSPTPKGCWVELQMATSPSGPWKTVGRVDAVKDDLAGKNQGTAVWVYGKADLTEDRTSVAYVRVRLCAADRPSGLRYLYIFGTCPTAATDPLTITYYWKSGDQLRKHIQAIPAGVERFEYRIETGPDVRNVKVVFAIPPSGN